jgi:hypothetical protein
MDINMNYPPKEYEPPSYSELRSTQWMLQLHNSHPLNPYTYRRLKASLDHIAERLGHIAKIEFATVDFLCFYDNEIILDFYSNKDEIVDINKIDNSLQPFLKYHRHRPNFKSLVINPCTTEIFFAVLFPPIYNRLLLAKDRTTLDNIPNDVFSHTLRAYCN